MASYKITVPTSRLGAQGTTVTDADLDAAQVNAAHLIAAGIIAPATKNKTQTEPEPETATQEN